jgi:hypothetical protein
VTQEPRRLTPSPADTPLTADDAARLLESRLCQVTGVNQNYVSRSGTQYHVQIEDRGPVLDRVTESFVRRVNMIVYANYGEPNARIVYGHDYDWDDIRTAEYNRQIEERIKELSAAGREIIEDKEERQISRIKTLIRRYYHTKDEAAKREFEESNALFPFLFSRAWTELKRERDERQGQVLPSEVISEAPAAQLFEEPPSTIESLVEESEPALEPEDVLYPLDPDLRDRVIEIERLISDIGAGLDELRALGRADDILLQTCRKLISRAHEILAGKEPSDVNVRRLDSMRGSLLTTWKQIQSRLKAR